MESIEWLDVLVERFGLSFTLLALFIYALYAEVLVWGKAHIRLRKSETAWMKIAMRLGAQAEELIKVRSDTGTSGETKHLDA